jgi:hypothetical protein
VINNHITINHPKLKEICEIGEQKYYSMVSALTCSPSDYKVALFDMGVYYDEITDFDFFCLMCKSSKMEDTRILLGDIDLSSFVTMIDEKSEDIVLYDSKNDIIIDASIYKIISGFLRTIHGFEKTSNKPANAVSRKYFIDKERRRLERQKDVEKESFIAPLISALVNCHHFKYDYSTIWDLPIYTFNNSVKSIQKHKNYDQIMQGVYSGTISIKDINTDQISWLK